MHNSLLLTVLGTLPVLIQPASANFWLWSSVTGGSQCITPQTCVPNGDQAYVGITKIGDTSCDTILNFWQINDSGFIPHCPSGSDQTMKPGSFRVTNCGFNEIWYARLGPKSNPPVLGTSLEVARDANFKNKIATCWANLTPSGNNDECKPYDTAHCAPSGFLGQQRVNWECFDDPGFSSCR